MPKDYKNERWEKAIAALLTSGTRRDAARKANIAVGTLMGYLNDPEFQKRYMAARAKLIKEATAKLQAGMSAAVDVLVSLATDTKVQEHARVSAARAILEFGIKLTEISDINERLDALESSMEDGL